MYCNDIKLLAFVLVSVILNNAMLAQDIIYIGEIRTLALKDGLAIHCFNHSAMISFLSVK